MSTNTISTDQVPEQPSGFDGGHGALCINCQSIDFDSFSCMRGIKEKQGKGGHGICLHPLSYAADEKCSLCSIFSDLKQRYTRSLHTVKWRLTGRSASTRYSKFLPDSIVLMVEPSGSSGANNNRDCLLFTNQEGVLSGRYVSDTVDWELVKSWLRFCQTHHSRRCKKKLKLGITRLKLVDCETRHVVELYDPPEDYVTLSYVWGQDKAECVTENGLPADLPGTIDDAIAAVKCLGLRYLWIDRYCIDQTESELKASLIESMGGIYNNSVLTIIAAAGDSPSHGLPGVGQTVRTAQQRVRVGCHALTKFSLDDTELVTKSKWNRRAWTFQEALLSRRKLVFTDKHVVYQCGGMYCAEDLSIPLHALHTQDLQEFRVGRLPRPFPMRGVGKAPQEIFQRMKEFCARDITYDHDVPKAFEGIFQQFASMKMPLQQFYGIPVLSPHFFSKDQKGFSARFAYGLSWKIHNSIAVTRRNFFPSWTWMEWNMGQDCTLEYRNNLFGRGINEVTYDDIDLIAIELADGRVYTPDILENGIGSISASDASPVYLHLFGFVFEVELIWDGNFYNEKDNKYRRWDLFVSGPRPQKLTVFCLVLSRRNMVHNRFHEVMVMLRADDGIFERIGFECIAVFRDERVALAVAFAKKPGVQMHVRMK